MKLYGFLLLLSLLNLSLTAKLPGIKVRITDEGLKSGMKFGLELLKQRIKADVFEDWNDLEEFSAIGTVNYTLSGIKVDDIEFPIKDTKVFLSDMGVHLHFNNVKATLSGNWWMQSWLLKNSGRVTIVVSGVNVSTVVKILLDEKGHPTWLLRSCSSIVQDLDINLDENSNWIYRNFVRFIKSTARDRINENLCLYIKDEIIRFSEDFRDFPASLIQIDEFAQIDNSLIESPTFQWGHVDLALKGTIYPVGNHTEPPFTPEIFILPVMGNSMLSIGVSDYFFRTALQTYYNSGAFNISIAKELSTYFNLTTDSFKGSIPVIAREFDEPQPVTLDLVANAAPMITLLPGHFNLQLVGSMDVVAVRPYSTIPITLFTLNITATTRVSFTIFDQRLMSALCLDSLHLSLAHSKVGLFKVSLLENFVSYILQNGVIPAANVFMKNGFPLSNMENLLLVGSTIKVNKGYLLISTNFKM